MAQCGTLNVLKALRGPRSVKGSANAFPFLLVYSFLAYRKGSRQDPSSQGGCCFMMVSYIQITLDLINMIISQSGRLWFYTPFIDERREQTLGGSDFCPVSLNSLTVPQNSVSQI